MTEVETPEEEFHQEAIKAMEDSSAFFLFTIDPPSKKMIKTSSKFRKLIFLDYCLFVSLLIVVFWYYGSLEKRLKEEYKNDH